MGGFFYICSFKNRKKDHPKSMKSILPLLSFVALTIFGAVFVQAKDNHSPMNATGMVHEAVDGTITLKAETGKVFYAWNDQAQEELKPFVGERVQVKGTSGVTAQGFDYIVWITTVTTF